ncbi:MAG TPA: TRAP transporter substrate-binding protein [Burkholderiaceae bacterium]|nr:TRAP transporter substrate-binding protein [Burkholderiaceae bacterium]
MNVLKKLMLGVACAAVSGLAPSIASAEETRTLRVGNFYPSHYLIVRGIMEPWAAAIEAETDGELKFDIMSSALGKNSAYMDLLQDGAIDIGFAGMGHTPGRFPVSQVVELPFMSPDPWAGGAAAWSVYERYGDQHKEFDGVKVVGMFAHSAPVMAMRKGQEVANLADLDGKKIRVGGDTAGSIIDALGGTPIHLPATEAQQALANGVADGITFPIDSVDFFKITPSIESITVFPGGLYADTFWLAFNQDVWDSLSEAHQKAIEKHSGTAIAMMGGAAWTAGDNVGRASFEEQGNIKWNTISDEEIEEAKEQLEPLVQKWVDAANKKGLPGEEILEYAKTMAESYKTTHKVNIP